jgi:hypothetical protein
LHVTHNTRPFVSRVRYAPESSSKPDRLEKDLTQAKALAGVLEAKAVTLREFKENLNSTVDDEDDMKTERLDDSKEDAVVRTGNDEKEDLEPSENGSEAVEKRIEKIMADFRDQRLDAEAYDAKKVI